MAGDGDVLRALASGECARKLKWPPRGPPTTSWDGVQEVTNRRVTKLWLGGKGLTGSIPPELGQLRSLTHLYLNENKLTGSIPHELGQLRKLEHLWLNNNQLTGSIPKELVFLTNLTTLWLGKNQLAGSIPPELGQLQSLRVLRLDGNKLTWSIPPELGSLTKLTFLDLSSNQLTGSIPSELGQLQSLQSLFLYENKLTGSISPELGQLQGLESLFLSDNKLTGSIPSQLGNLAQLTELWLNDNQLAGSIPPELGNLNNLTYLSLRANQLTGSIPPELGQLRSLTHLYLYGNKLTDNPWSVTSRAAVAQWQGTLASRGQQIEAEHRQSEQATETVRRRKGADRLRVSQAAVTAEAERQRQRIAREVAEADALRKQEIIHHEERQRQREEEAERLRVLQAAAAAEGERQRIARETAEAAERRKQELILQQEIQRQQDEEERRLDTIEPWLRDAGFASDAAAAFAKRFKDEHVATLLAIRSFSREDILGLARGFGMHENLVKLLVAALDKVAAAERQRLCEEAADGPLGRWLQDVSFSSARAGHYALELSAQDVDDPEDLVDTAGHDPALLQHILDEVKMPMGVLRNKLTSAINRRLAALRDSKDEERKRREQEAAEEKMRRRESDLDAARGSDMALWLHHEGQFELDLAAELSLRMRASGVGGRGYLQLMQREDVQNAMLTTWQVPELGQVPFLKLWERLKDGPRVDPNQSSVGVLRLRDSKYGQLVSLWADGGQSTVFEAPVLEGAEGVTVFIKRMEAPRQTRTFERERAMLGYLARKRVEHVPRFEHAESAEPGGAYHYIVMEKGTKNLRQQANGYPRKERGERDWSDCVRRWTKQALRVLRELHRLGVVWADLKPENLVGTAQEVRGRNGELMGVDFGSCGVQPYSPAAQDLSGYPDVTATVSAAAGQAYTASYAAPELARCILGNRECTADPALDMWALGMVLFWLVTGRDYFAPLLERGAAPNGDTILRELAQEGFEVELRELPPRQLYTRLLKRLLKVDPKLRISAEEAHEDLESSGSIAASKSLASRSHNIALVQGNAERQLLLQEQAERSTGGNHEEVMQELRKQTAVMERLDRNRRLIHELVLGELDCPRVFVLVPADKNLWNVPKRWFGAPMQLHFLCEYGHPSERPCNGGKGFSVLNPKQWIKEHAAAVQISLLAIQLAARLAMNVAAPGTADALPLNALTAALDFKALDFDPEDLDTAVALMGDIGHEDAVWYVDGALCAQFEGEVVSAETPEAQRARTATGAAYRAIVQYLNDSHRGWNSKLGDLSKQIARADDKMAWVCGAHASAWRASTPVSRRPTQQTSPPPLPPRTDEGAGVSGSGVKGTGVVAPSSPVKAKCSCSVA